MAREYPAKRGTPHHDAEEVGWTKDISPHHIKASPGSGGGGSPQMSASSPDGGTVLAPNHAPRTITRPPEHRAPRHTLAQQ